MNNNAQITLLENELDILQNKLEYLDIQKQDIITRINILHNIINEIKDEID